MKCLNSNFRIIQFDAESPQTQQIFIRSFPRFFFLSVGRYIWGNDHMAKDCGRVAFPVILEMIPQPTQTEKCYPDQLAAVISHLGNPEKDQGHYMTFLRIFGQWIRFNDFEVEAVEESAALSENFPGTEGSLQTATILLYVADNRTNNSVNSLLIKCSLSSCRSSSVN
jgi:hypothetical protein